MFLLQYKKGILFLVLCMRKSVSSKKHHLYTIKRKAVLLYVSCSNCVVAPSRPLRYRVLTQYTSARICVVSGSIILRYRVLTTTLSARYLSLFRGRIGEDSPGKILMWKNAGDSFTGILPQSIVVTRWFCMRLLATLFGYNQLSCCTAALLEQNRARTYNLVNNLLRVISDSDELKPFVVSKMEIGR